MTDLSGKFPADDTGIRPVDAASRAEPRQISHNVRLQYLRGFAATAVMLVHASDSLGEFRGDARFTSVFTHFFGAYGVAVFFALSGALMAQLIQHRAPFRFLLDRILRIYPPVLLVVAASAVAFLVAGTMRLPDPLTLTLIPLGQREYYLGNVEWTLLFEMSYYVLLTLLAALGLRRWAEPAALLWLVGLIGLALAGLEPRDIQTPTITQLPLQTANAAFLIGFLLPRLLSSRFAPPASALLAAALALSIAAFMSSQESGRWLPGLGAALLVAAALRAPVARPTGWLGRQGALLGDASYVLYLIHIPVIMVSAIVLPAAAPPVAVWVFWVVGSITLAYLLGPADQALHGRLKRWARALPERHVTVAACAFLAIFLAVAGWADARERGFERAAAKARAALDRQPPIERPGSVMADVEGVDLLPDGRLVVRGHVVDLEAPAGETHVAILQNGQTLGFDRMRRMRTSLAKAAGRPQLANIRFGFSILTRAGFDCSAGPVDLRAILADGRVIRLPSHGVETACSQQPSVPAPERVRKGG